MKPKPFDFEQAAKLENYVRKRYRNQLPNGALTFYLCAFQPLERSGLGLCQPITATYPTLAAAGFRNKSRLREVLDSLNGVLCEVLPGKPIKGGKEATRLRRYSLPELMNGEPRCKLIDCAPADALQLAEILYSRTFVYGIEPACRPSWGVKKTGRVQSSKPNVQGDSEGKRIENLCAGLKPGQVLISADFKQAEPTIIQTAIGYHFETDPYPKNSSSPKVLVHLRFPALRQVLPILPLRYNSAELHSLKQNSHPKRFVLLHSLLQRRAGPTSRLPGNLAKLLAMQKNYSKGIGRPYFPVQLFFAIRSKHPRNP